MCFIIIPWCWNLTPIGLHNTSLSIDLTSTILLLNAEKWCTAKKYIYSFCINQILPTFSFTLLRLTVSAISLHHFCIICWLAALPLSIFENPVSSSIPLHLLIFKNSIFETGVLVTCIFKNWLSADWELADIMQNGTNTKMPVWWAPIWFKGLQKRTLGLNIFY